MTLDNPSLSGLDVEIFTIIVFFPSRYLASSSLLGFLLKRKQTKENGEEIGTREMRRARFKSSLIGDKAFKMKRNEFIEKTFTRFYLVPFSIAGI